MNVIFLFCLCVVVNGIEVIEPINVWGTEPLGIFVSWNPNLYESTLEVTGYKINLWTVKMNVARKIDLVNAEEYPGLVQDDFVNEEYQQNKTLMDIPRTITVEGNYKSQVLITDIEYNVVYELRLMGYKDDVDGPMSYARRIKIVKGDGYQAVIQKTMNGCLVSVPNILQLAGDDYPFSHNSYF